MTLPSSQCTFGGLTFGAGTAYEVVSVVGLGAQPPKTNDLDLVGGGVFPARDIRSAKLVTVTAEINGTPGSALAGLVSAWAAAWKTSTNVDSHLVYHFDGIAADRYLIGRSRGWDTSWDYIAEQGLFKVVATFFSPDGLIYDAVSNLAVDF